MGIPTATKIAFVATSHNVLAHTSVRKRCGQNQLSCTCRYMYSSSNGLERRMYFDCSHNFIIINMYNSAVHTLVLMALYEANIRCVRTT